MKKYTLAKHFLIHITLLAGIIIIVSLHFEQHKVETQVAADELHEDNSELAKKTKDAQFLVYAAEINLKEIQLGRLAQQNGQDIYVRELGRMIEDVHIQSQRELKALAKSKSIIIPTSTAKYADYSLSTLDEKSGNDFDKAYADNMISRHKVLIHVFEKAVQDSYDMDVKNWVTSSLSHLRNQLDYTIKCQERIN